MRTTLWQQAVLVSSAAAIVCAATSYVAGQAPPAPAPAAPASPQTPAAPPSQQAPAAPVAQPAPGAPAVPGQGAAQPGRGGGGGRGGPAQWGRGSIRVAVITKGHAFNPREEFFAMFDSMGADINWTSVEHPAATVLLQPKYADLFDVYVFYDIGGAGLGTQARQGGPAPVIPPGSAITTNNRFYPPPPAEFKAEFPKLLQAGTKGFVFLHHANAAWAHVWPEYSEVVGSACDWYAPTTVRGIDHPNMGFHSNTPQKITFVDKAHPITKDLADFELTDEAYTCHMFEDSVHALARTSFQSPEPTRYLNAKVPFSNLTAYVKSAENSPVFYTQMGHGAGAWNSPAYRQLVLNAIKWAASPEAKAWAKANPKKIFK